MGKGRNPYPPEYRNRNETAAFPCRAGKSFPYWSGSGGNLAERASWASSRKRPAPLRIEWNAPMKCSSEGNASGGRAPSFFIPVAESQEGPWPEVTRAWREAPGRSSLCLTNGTETEEFDTPLAICDMNCEADAIEGGLSADGRRPASPNLHPVQQNPKTEVPSVRIFRRKEGSRAFLLSLLRSKSKRRFLSTSTEEESER